MNIYAENKIKTVIRFFVVMSLFVGCFLGMSFRSYAEEKLSKPIATAETILDSQYSSFWEGDSSHNLISWDKVDGANMYYVYRRDNSKTKFSLLAKTTSVEYKDKNIKDNTAYYYIIKAVKLSNGKVVKKSDYSEVVHCITGLKRFPELTIYAMDDTNIAIGIMGTSADDYVIYYSDDRGGSYKEIKLDNYIMKTLKTDSTGLVTLHGYILGDLKPDKVYYIRIQTVNIDDGKIIRKKGISDIVHVKTMKSNETTDKYIKFSNETTVSVNAETIHLISANNSDIKKLSQMKNLKSIIIEKCTGSDLSPLSELKKLESLWISPFDWHGLYYPGCNISDISALENLKNLKHLVINCGNITDLSPLKKIKNLEVISFAQNNISDLSPIVNLKKLVYADFSGNNIKNISSLKNCLKLERLNLSYNAIKNFSVIKKLKNLKLLELAGNDVSDISFLSKNKKLIALNLDDNNISNLSVLEELKNIRVLHINNNGVNKMNSLISIFNNGKLDNKLLESTNHDAYFFADVYYYYFRPGLHHYPKYKLSIKNNKLSTKEQVKLKNILPWAEID